MGAWDARGLGGSSGGLTLLDLTGGGTQNSGNFDGSSTWGASSHPIAAASHGRLDSGLDAAAKFAAGLTPPAGARALHLQLYVPTPPGSNPTGGVAEIMFGASTQETLASNEGHYGGFRLTTGGVLKVGGILGRWGDLLTSGGTVVGALKADMLIWLSGGSAQRACVWMDGATSGFDQKASGNALASAVTTLHPFISVGMVAASPSGTMDWGSGVTLSSAWIS